MATTVDVLAIRKRLGRSQWHPPQSYGDTGWSMVSTNLKWRLILAESIHNGITFIHATLDSFDRGELPTLDQIRELHLAVFGEDGHSALQLTGPAPAATR